MRRTLTLATAVLALSLAQAASGADANPKNNEIVAGEVTTIDPAHNRITVRSADGKLYEFEASKQTLADLKVGDRIEAKKRAEK
jgi:predicted outer membrane protein